MNEKRDEGAFDLAEADRLLTTTRAVRRRLDLDRPVPREVVERCIEIAMQAPIGGNEEVRRWVVVTEQALKDEIAAAYRARAMPYLEEQFQDADERSDEQKLKVVASARFLATNLERAPVLVIPCIEPEIDLTSNVSAVAEYASVLPAVWNFQLALRARGLGTVHTTLHLYREREVADLLGIPAGVNQVGLLPVAYTVGRDFKPAGRNDPRSVTYWNGWPTSP
jgi:nitroreductase